jgi:hypothetical protein
VNQKQFRKFLDRDGGCVHCGDLDTAVPQHRLNRGAGGKNAKADQVANIIVLCSLMNNLIESDSKMAELALANGWKLRSWSDPLTSAVWYATLGQWFLLDNDYNMLNYRDFQPEPPQ